MNEENCVIIVPTHSSYLDVVKNFMILEKKYWSDCKYKIIVAITGEDISVPSINTLYCGRNATLPLCIYLACQKCKAQYYMCFLGDAFINSKVNNKAVEYLIHSMKKNNLDFLRIRTLHSMFKKKSINKYMRYINSADRYAHSFIAFVASQKFIEEEFSGVVTDLDFENKYLEMTTIRPRFYFENHAIVTKRIFDIYPGIIKGKWDCWIYFLLKIKNPELDFKTRKILPLKDNVYCWCADFFIKFIPDTIRKKVKKHTKNKMMVTKD